MQRTVGFDGLNALALKEMRRWLVLTVLQEEERIRAAAEKGEAAELDLAKFQHTEGTLLWQLGEQVQAERVDRESLATRERLIGPDSLDTLASVNQLALLLKAQGKFDEATPLFQRALEGTEKILGPSHPDVFPIVVNLASQLRMKGKYAEAEPVYRRALAGWQEQFGPDHPDTLMSMNNLSYLLYQKGDQDEAEEHARAAVAGREKVLSLPTRTPSSQSTTWPTSFTR